MRRLVAVVAVLGLSVGISGCANQIGSPGLPSPTAVTSAPTPVAAPTPTPDPTPTRLVASPKPDRPYSAPAPLTRVLQSGMVGEDVRELQIRLRHAGMIPLYDATDSFGGQTASAVSAFQKSAGLAQTGVVDQPTWDALRAVSYDPTPAELTNRDVGPWYVGPANEGYIMDLQFRFAQLGSYSGAVDGVYDEEVKAAIGQYRVSVGLPYSEIMDERTYNLLMAATRTPSYSELYTEAPVANDTGQVQQLDARCMTGRVICVSMAQSLVSLVINGEPVTTRATRFGMPGYETHPGQFRILMKKWDEVSHIFGTRYPMPYSTYYDSGYSLHFSDDFADNGYQGGSHGCVNIRDYSYQKWFYEQVHEGDPVIIY